MNTLVFLSAFGELVIALSILVACFVIVVIAYGWFRKTWVKIVSFLALFIFGFFVYQGLNEGSVLWVTNNALSAFFPSRGEYEPSGLLNKPYQFFHLLVYLYAGLVVLSLPFAGKMMNRCKRMLSWRKRYVFFGAGEPSRILAKEILNAKDVKVACWFCLDENLRDDTKLFNELDEMGAIVFYKNLDNNSVRKMCVRQAFSRYFFLDDDDDFNVRMATSIIEVFKKEPPKETAHLYVRTDLQVNFFENMDISNSNVEIHVFNNSDLMTRRFIKKYPMLDCSGIALNTDKIAVSGTFKMLLLGFGWTGRELLEKCICGSQFKGSAFSATIIDADYEQKSGDHPIMYNECINEYNLRFNPEGVYDVYAKRFWDWAGENLKGFNRIVVSLGDDKTNIEVATKLSRLLVFNGMTVDDCRCRVFALVRHKWKYSYYESGNMPFVLFGDIRNLYTRDIIINDSEDRIAKMVNYVYSQWQVPHVDVIDWTEAENLWKRTKLFDKDSCRAAAHNIDDLFRVATGKDISKLSDDDLEKALVEFEEVIQQKDKLEILAGNEHLRWNAFHFTNGIRLLKLDEITGEKAKLSDTNGNLLKHGCLVKYENLDAVSDKVNANRLKKGNNNTEEFKESDRRIVRHYPLFIREQYDRNTAMETLKVIRMFGCKIAKEPV